ncbi:hypothetical protein HMPREF9943_01233 [Eggerthia catenaformis OT 569 = DSM 20559]|uniref:Uncharacterized protein n=1 Tax=Eggerthia catenaformis OT 569 = DSM 20559 TaxID=999415 RepID=M2NE51_9FIRM|nr:hypothetical protein [Eggerthia catenaformis]EMD16478.1 hypothetical protein HMPREF9943_01233 [Eggerthia catenaformis OT 569 = DSM 20559]OUC51019.1 hypothetical protein B7939_08225 [Eggerthia catenaformis]
MARKRSWTGIIFGIIWFLMALFVLINYLSGNLGSFYVPRILMIFYDIFGIIPGAIIQLVLSGLLVFFSAVPRRK